MGHIFISYSHKNKTYAQKLQQHLLEEGFDAWIDDRIDYGMEWPREIEKRLNGCDAFILIMSPGSLESYWVQNEFNFARHLKKPIFPILLEGEAWWHVGTMQYVDVRDGKLPPKKFFVRLAEVVSHSTVSLTSEEIAAQKRAEHESETAEKAAREKAKQEANEKAVQEKRAKEAAEKAAREKAEREATEQAARKKAEKEAAEKATREKVKREAAERTANEKAERAAAKIAARKASWENFLQKIKVFLKTAQQSLGSLKLRKKTLIITVVVSLVVVFTLIGFFLLINPPFYFSGFSEGGVNIYSYKNNRLTRITQALDGSVNLSPAIGFRSDIYFTSIRTRGKPKFTDSTGTQENLSRLPIHLDPQKAGRRQ